LRWDKDAIIVLDPVNLNVLSSKGLAMALKLFGWVVTVRFSLNAVGLGGCYEKAT